MRHTAFQCEALRSGAGLETAFHILQCATFSDRHDREVSSRATRRLAKYLVRVGFRRSETNLFSIERFIDKAFKLYEVLKLWSQSWSEKTRICDMDCVLCDGACRNTRSITVQSAM